MLNIEYATSEIKSDSGEYFIKFIVTSINVDEGVYYHKDYIDYYVVLSDTEVEISGETFEVDELEYLYFDTYEDAEEWLKVIKEMLGTEEEDY